MSLFKYLMLILLSLNRMQRLTQLTQLSELFRARQEQLDSWADAFPHQLELSTSLEENLVRYDNGVVMFCPCLFCPSDYFETCLLLPTR